MTQKHQTLHQHLTNEIAQELQNAKIPTKPHHQTIKIQATTDYNKISIHLNTKNIILTHTTTPQNPYWEYTKQKNLTTQQEHLYEDPNLIPNLIKEIQKLGPWPNTTYHNHHNSRYPKTPGFWPTQNHNN